MFLCRVPPIPADQVLGVQTARAFGSAFWAPSLEPKGETIEGSWISMLVVFTISVVLALYTLSPTRGAKITNMRYMVAIWIVVTGAVDLNRLVWDVSRIALLSAPLHNLFEWGIVSYLLFDKRTATQLFPLFTLFILAIYQGILFAGKIDKDSGIGRILGDVSALNHASLYPQISGIWVDWLLVVTMIFRYLNYKKSKKVADAIKAFYIGSIATSLHMVEIIPLVLLLLGLKPFVDDRPTYWISSLICFSTPIAMFMYAEFARAWDRAVAIDEVRQSTDFVDLVSTILGKAKESVFGKDMRAYRKKTKNLAGRDGAVYLERSLPAKVTLALLGVCFVLALMSNLLPLILVPKCSQVAPYVHTTSLYE